jgi:hypothetical protein
MAEHTSKHNFSTSEKRRREKPGDGVERLARRRESAKTK